MSRTRIVVVVAVAIVVVVGGGGAVWLAHGSTSPTTAPTTAAPATVAPATVAPATVAPAISCAKHPRKCPSTTVAPAPLPPLPPLTSSTIAPATTQLPQPVVNVTTMGALPDGKTNDTAAINEAIAKAQANGKGTVYFPAGKYLVGQSSKTTSIAVDSGAAITIAGAGMNESTLIETDPSSDLLGIKVDGTVVQDLGLDTRTYGAGHCIGVVANNTTVQRVHIMSGTRTFALYYAGPPGARPTAPSYNTGNQVLDSVVEDGVSDDGFSFSFQQNAVIRDIVHQGSRLALYVDQNVLVDGYQYSPGMQPGATVGFYITPPSNHITLENFVSTGEGGVIGQSPAGGPDRVSTDVTIAGEVLRRPGFKLRIGDVNGLTIENSSLVGEMFLNPGVSATQVLVQNCTVSAVTFSPRSGATIDNVVFQGDTYEPVGPITGRPSTATFVTERGLPSFSAAGGQFHNQAGGFQSGAAQMQQSVPGA